MADVGSRNLRLITLVPNGLSSLRLALAVGFPFVPQVFAVWRMIIVVVAGLTDVLDGTIARRMGVTSMIGGLLDGLADKLFVLSVLTTMAWRGEFEPWQMLLLLVRDVTVGLIALYAALLRDWPAFSRMRPSIFGKLATLMQFAVMLAVIGWPSRAYPILVVAWIACVVAAVEYFKRFVQEMRSRS